mgnify:CR=1 FL=1
MRTVYLIFAWLSCLVCAENLEKPSFIVGDIQYQLGNQMFQVAAVYSLALDHQCEAYFPDLATQFWWNFSTNREQVLWRLNTSLPPQSHDSHFFEPHFNYTPIPFTPRMRIRGSFSLKNTLFIINKKSSIYLLLLKPFKTT